MEKNVLFTSAVSYFHQLRYWSRRRKNAPHPPRFHKSCVSGPPDNSGNGNAREGEKGKDIWDTCRYSHTHHTGRGRASRLFLFFQTKCRDNTCVHGSLLTFGSDTPLYGHPTEGLALRDMCVIHTGCSHNTSLQNQGYMKGGSGGEQPGQGKIRWRQREELEGKSRQRGRGCHSFIYSSILIHLLSPSCCYLPLWSWGGGHSWAQCGSVQWGKGVCGVPCMPFSLRG